MSNEICWLITVLYEAHHTLIRCAVKAECDAVPSVCVEYPMEVESREILHSFLPRNTYRTSKWAISGGSETGGLVRSWPSVCHVSSHGSTKMEGS